MPKAPLNCYATLGVKRNASEREIKEAFRELARKEHPDVKQRTAEELFTPEQAELKAKFISDASRRFEPINEAYETLSNQEKRNQYNISHPEHICFKAEFGPHVENAQKFGKDVGERFAKFTTTKTSVGVGAAFTVVGMGIFAHANNHIDYKIKNGEKITFGDRMMQATAGLTALAGVVLAALGLKENVFKGAVHA